jgi:hypothetical protein
MSMLRVSELTSASAPRNGVDAAHTARPCGCLASTVLVVASDSSRDCGSTIKLATVMIRLTVHLSCCARSAKEETHRHFLGLRWTSRSRRKAPRGWQRMEEVKGRAMRKCAMANLPALTHRPDIKLLARGVLSATGFPLAQGQTENHFFFLLVFASPRSSPPYATWTTTDSMPSLSFGMGCQGLPRVIQHNLSLGSVLLRTAIWAHWTMPAGQSVSGWGGKRSTLE